MKFLQKYSAGVLTRGFLTGLAFIGPLLLTAIVLAWVFGQLIGFVGPESGIGRLLTAGGRLFLGDRTDPLVSFAVGVAIVVGLVTALGLLVEDRARKALEKWVDGLIGRVPFLGNVYRPVAQLVRSMGGDRAGQMATMGVCRIEFGGGVETIAFLASAEVFDIGGGPARLVLVPTAPIPIGGALLLVAAHKVHVIPDMKFDDLAKLYLTMGMTPPANMRTVVFDPAVVP